MPAVASSTGPLSHLFNVSHFFACNIESWERGPGDKAMPAVQMRYCDQYGLIIFMVANW